MKDFGRDMEQMANDLRAAMESIQVDIGATVREAIGDVWVDDPTGHDIGEEEYSREIQVEPHADLSVNNVSGSVSIRAEEGNVIRIQARKHGSRRRMEGTRIDTQINGGAVSVRTRGDMVGRLGIRGNVCSVDYNIVVPPDCTVQVEGVSADVRVTGVQANVGVRTVSGDVGVQHLCGDLTLTTVSGDIIGSEVDGELMLRTTSGDAQLRSSHLRRFNLNTVSGDILLETPLATGEHYLAKTISGDLQISVPPDTGATVQMKSVSGDVHSDLPAEIIKSSRRNWQGRIGGGGAHVEMSSVSGDLRIALGSGAAHRRSPEPTPPSPRAARAEEPASVSSEPRPITPPAPVSPAPSVPSTPGAPPAPGATASAAEPERVSSTAASNGEPETTRILRMLAQGEISVDDAMSRLDALNK